MLRKSLTFRGIKKFNKNNLQLFTNDLVADLKSREQNSINDKQRMKSVYTDNFVASLSLPLTDKEIRKYRAKPKYLLELSKEYIEEHAARRVDLFFYTLIAYYKTERLPIQGDTLFQHGLGRQTVKRVGLTQACHSSFFPSFVDQTITDKIKITSPTSRKNNIEIKRSIISGTHFFDSLNSTVELPLFVNNFDSNLEGKIETPSLCRQKSLEIVRKVSCGILNPLEGLREFFLIMIDAFEHLASNKLITKSGNPYLSRDTQIAPIDIKNDLLELVRRGTFKNKWLSAIKEVSNEYIEMLLRLTPAEKIICFNNLNERTKIYDTKIIEIQNEILTTKSSFGYSA